MRAAGQDELDAAGALLAVDPEPDEEDDPDEEDEPDEEDDEDEESDDEDDSDLAGLLVVEAPLSEPDGRESVR
ncbi:MULTISPECIES: hypothetical protein [Micromonospora]|uniref:hypothetical protein n=1 Tax=Micromonospora TaxID=1873 RepID=UPI0008DA957F|nr:MULTISPECIES: hypothetical protein [Micromonospora]OHX04367.1 hypothetical protein BFV98_15895 [Micromonospora sp. WMMB235]